MPTPDPHFSLIRRLSQFGTLLQTRFCGVEAGRDEFGNRYYRARHTPKARAKNAGWSMQASPKPVKCRPNGISGCITRPMRLYPDKALSASHGKNRISRI